MTVEPPDWAKAPSTAVKNPPPRRWQSELPNGDAVRAMRDQLIEMLLQQVTLAVQGFLTFGTSAFIQLSAWATSIVLDGLSSLAEALGVPPGDVALVRAWFSDLRALIGDPLGMGTGTVTIPAVGDIPLLGPAVAEIGTVVGAYGAAVTAAVNEFYGMIGGTVADAASLATWLLGMTPIGALVSGLGGVGADLTALAAALAAIPAPQIAGVLSNASIGISGVTALGGYLTNLTSGGILALAGLASGALPSGVTAAISNITGLGGYLTHLSSAGVLDAVSAVTGLGGYLTNLSSGGVLALAGLASGALPSGVTAGIAQITSLGGYLTHLSGAGVLDAVTSVNGLAGYLTNLTSGGVLALAGLASGALPGGITLAGSALTGLATGVGAWLTAGGALPSATSATISQITSLGGYLAHLSSAGVMDAVTSVTGLSGYLTNLTSGGVLALAGLASGALPAGVTAAISNVTSLGGYLTHLSSAGILDAVTSITGLPGYLTNLSSGGVLALAGLASGALPAGVTAAISNVTGLAGYLTNLTSGGVLSLAGLAAGAIPAGITLAGSQLTGAVAAALVSGVTATEQSIIDGINTAVGFPTGGLVSTVQTALQAIPHANVLGVLGPADIGSALQTAVDTHWQALTGTSLTGLTFGNLQNVLSQAMGALGFNYANPSAPQAGSTSAITLTNTSNIASRAVQKPISDNIDSTCDAVFPIKDVWTQTTLPTVAVTQQKSAWGYITVRDGGIKESIPLLGYPTGGSFTNISEVYLNLYKVNTTTGLITKLYTTPNIVSLLPIVGAPAWFSYPIPALNYVTTTQGDVYAVEMQLVGTGTYNLVGQTLSAQMPAHLTAVPALPGASRGITTITYDTAGSVYTKNTNGTTIAGSFTHTPAAAGEAVIVLVSCASSGGVGAPSSWTRKATYGSTDNTTNTGTLMTSLGVIAQGSNLGWVEMFGLLNAPSGTKTVAVSATGGSGTFVTVAANSFSYANVVSFGTAVTAGPTTSTAMSSGAIASATGHMVVQAFVAVNGGAHCTFSAPNHSSRMIQDQLNGAWGTGTGYNDAPGAASVTFTETDSSSSGYVSLAVPLVAGVAAAPATIANPTTSPLAYAAATPWFGLSGVVGTTNYLPALTEYTTAGTFTYTKPTWASYFDIIVVGAGGGSVAGAGLVGGNGGGGGFWSAQRITAAQAASAATFAITVGAGGAAAAAGGVGGGGGAASCAVTGWGTVTGSGGAGGVGNRAAGFPLAGVGFGPGNEVFNDAHGNVNTYYGGPDQSAASLGGNSPGGGAAGGQAAYYSAFVNGNVGAPGAVFILAYQ